MARRRTYTYGDHRRKMAERRKTRAAYWAGVERLSALLAKGHTPLCAMHHPERGCKCSVGDDDGTP